MSCWTAVVFNDTIHFTFPVGRVVQEHERTRREQDVLAKERIVKDRAMEKDHQRIEKLQQNARANKELMEKMKENIHSEYRIIACNRQFR